MIVAFAACLLSASTSMAAASREQAALAEAWGAFYGDDIQRAGQIAEKLARSKHEGTRVEAMHLAARVLWHTGEKKHREKAATIWKQLAKASTRHANLKRQSIATALQLAAEDDVDGAVGELAGLLNDPYPETCTLEAALLVARLRTAGGDLDKAKRACDFVTYYAGKLRKGNELPEAVIEPFAKAAEGLRHRAGKSEAEWAFLAAETLRRAGRHMAAIRAYREVMTTYPDTPFASRSEYSIGLCLVARESIPAAVRHWQGFIAAAPTGAYRGQAYVGLIDVCLDVPRAGGRRGRSGEASRRGDRLDEGGRRQRR
jgi:tetratricopeptide (TPR) repeat protein